MLKSSSWCVLGENIKLHGKSYDDANGMGQGIWLCR